MAQRNFAPLIRLLPWLVLMAMLTVTWWLWDHEREHSRKELRTQFEFALRETVSRVDQRKSAYEQMLRGVQGLFATTDLTDRRAVRDYLETLQLDANFAGIQGIGVIQWVPGTQKAAHMAAMQRLGVAGYGISPPGVREVYTPIIQSVPEAGRYRQVLGWDAWADPIRRQAMQRACDSGMPAITEKLRLAFDKTDDAPPGFVMYLPVFARDKPVDSVAQRRAALIGWVYAPFHMRDFMASLYGGLAPGLALAIYDGIQPSESSLMYRTDGTPRDSVAAGGLALSAKEYLVVSGHTWTLALSTEEAFEARFRRKTDGVIAAIGGCLSLSMALLVWFMVAGRAHALRLADAMTLELRHMAQHDPLTGLPNRALFSDRFQQKLLAAQRHGHRVAMIFIDLDHFKPVNDSHGHAVGDVLLQQVAQRLQETVRASDTIGRLGGDEFAVLMGNLHEADLAINLAEKIHQAITQPFRVQALTLNITCSIGVAVYPDDGMNEDDLTRSADNAMYVAKKQGRNGVRQVEDRVEAP